MWLLLEQKADVDAKTNGDETMLHWAASNRDNAVVKLLLRCGPDILAENKQTALQKTANNEHETTVHLYYEREQISEG